MNAAVGSPAPGPDRFTLSRADPSAGAPRVSSCAACAPTHAGPRHAPLVRRFHRSQCSGQLCPVFRWSTLKEPLWPPWASTLLSTLQGVWQAAPGLSSVVARCRLHGSCRKSGMHIPSTLLPVCPALLPGSPGWQLTAARCLPAAARVGVHPGLQTRAAHAGPSGREAPRRWDSPACTWQADQPSLHGFLLARAGAGHAPINTRPGSAPPDWGHRGSPALQAQPAHLRCCTLL